MKTTNKILAGLGITAIVGGTLAYFASEAIIEKFQASKNRHKVVNFVNNRLNGNEKALDFVDKMTDDEVANLLTAADRVDNLRGKVSEYAGQAQSTAMDYWQLLMDSIEHFKD